MMIRFCAWILLFLLLVVPFFNWRLGATFWMCAILVFVCQQVFTVKPFQLNRPQKEEDIGEEEPPTEDATKEKK